MLYVCKTYIHIYGDLIFKKFLVSKCKEGGQRGCGPDVPILFFLNTNIPNLELKNPESRQNYLIFAATGNAISRVRTSKRQRASDIFLQLN